MKWCKFCETEKPLDQFHKHQRSPDGKNKRCKACVKAQSHLRVVRQLETLEPRRVCRRCKIEKDTLADFPKNAHGPGGLLTICKWCASEDSARNRWGVDDILKRVDAGYCEICQDKLRRNNYAVDHDHACCNSNIRSCGNCIRGLICQSCNHGLGNFKEDTERMTKAIDYLRRHKVQ